MSANYIYEPFIHEQTSASSTWTISHNFNRDINVAVYINNIIAFPEIEPDIGDPLNIVNISFYEKGVPVAKTGKAVIS